MNTGKRVPRDFWVWLVMAMAVVGSGYAWQQARGGGGLCWLLLSAGGTAYLAFFTLRHMEANRPSPEAPAYPTLGAANHLSLLRGLAVALMLGFFCPRTAAGWTPALLYTFVALSDWWDGFLARRTRHPSLLGERLDLLVDGAGVLIASAFAVVLGRLPWWYLFVGFARYIFLAWEALLRAAGRPPRPLPPDPQRRANAGLMMSFLAAALWPVFPPQAVALVGLWFFVPFAVGFLRDGGRVASTPPFLSRWERKGGSAEPREARGKGEGERRPAPGLPGKFWGVARLLLRLTGAAGLLFVLWGQPGAPALRRGGGMLAVLLALGVLPRLTALGGLLALGAGWAGGFPDALTSALLTATAFYGGGAACLWAPDDRFFLTHVT